MEITSEISSIIASAKEDFEKRFKETLVTDSLREIITKSVPANEVETKRLNDPEFREKFAKLLTPATREVIEKFENVGQFDTGNMLSSMVNSLGESVSLESTYRENCAVNDIRLDRVEGSVEAYIEQRFAGEAFSSPDIRRRAEENFKIVLSSEDAAGILEEIKDEVKTAIEETEDKNKLIEGTTKEIVDYKKEMAPPDDQYVNPEDGDAGSAEPNGEDGAATTEDEANTLGAEGEDDTSKENPTDDNSNTAPAEGSGDGTENTEDNEPNGEDAPKEPTASEGSEETPSAESASDDSDADTDSPDVDINEDLDAIGGEGGDTASGTDAGATDTLDLGDTSDAGAEPSTDGTDGLGDIGGSTEPAPAPAATEPAATPAPAQPQSAGIVINITGADLAKAKEALSIMTAEHFAAKIIPTHPRTLDEMELPNKTDLACEACTVVGDLKREFKIQGDSLRYGISQVGEAKSEEALRAKLGQLEEISTEAFKEADYIKDAMYRVGVSPDGLVNSKESTFAAAKNIIKMIAGTRVVTATPRPYDSVENVLANAFDVLQLRQECKYAEGEVDNDKANDLYSRESVFYRNIAALEDKPELKAQAEAVLDLTDAKFVKAMTPNFITDYKIKAHEVNVSKNANADINATITSRVEEKFEKLWGRKLNAEEKEIVQAVTSNQDCTNICPNPFEKFLVKLSKDASINQSTEAVKFNFTPEEKSNILFKAKIFTAFYKAAEAFDLVEKTDEYVIDDFCDKFGL